MLNNAEEVQTGPELRRTNATTRAFQVTRGIRTCNSLRSVNPWHKPANHGIHIQTDFRTSSLTLRRDGRCGNVPRLEHPSPRHGVSKKHSNCKAMEVQCNEGRKYVYVREGTCTKQNEPLSTSSDNSAGKIHSEIKEEKRL
jgi:hypothetical protein